MSSEAVKKRGRPKKVISDPVEVEVPETTKKTTTRAKSTKAGPKTATAKASTSAKPPVAEKPISKPIASSAAALKVASKPSGVSTTSPSKLPPAPAKPTVNTSVSPESSKILKGLREQFPKTAPPAAEPSKLSKQTPTSTVPKPPPSFPAQTKAPPPIKTSNPIKSSTKQASTSNKLTPAVVKPVPPPPAVKPIPKLHVPIAALNSEIVSNISTRAGARPNASQGNPLPKNYKSVANKVTMAIVAMPIAIVTSWVLYERLVLGEDRKHLVKPGMAMVETPSAGDANTEGSESRPT
ncbi:hypothetical protein L207DRAFT_642760 [Hyaloscypha variabilis F]|uniref:Uncharacterized protein n=1 Tax=Hyaloscypha variabilis (strain UAMH 11265 / GT02V1 / F) TaxID=1149755 RepID=A0A2J6QRR8_HYAVF|nr:hypothetical protein L207DRAFT_642760 [Hyaloscypha variabilis F]